MRGVEGFYGKIALGRPIRIAGPGLRVSQDAYSRFKGFWGALQVRVRSGSVASCALWAEAVLEVAAVKGWRYGGEKYGAEDLRGHGGTRVYRRRAIAEMGRLRHWAGLIWALCAVAAGLSSMQYVCRNMSAGTWARTGGCLYFVCLFVSSRTPEAVEASLY